MIDKNNEILPKKFVDDKVKSKKVQTESLDENMHLMVYGNLKITLKDTGEVLVNKRV